MLRNTEDKFKMDFLVYGMEILFVQLNVSFIISIVIVSILFTIKEIVIFMIKALFTSGFDFPQLALV